MKMMIVSDIHGSAYYCERTIEALNREGADKLLLLGDILYHGARNDLPRDYAPKRVTEMLNAVKDKILCVRGNCDSEVDATVLQFPFVPDYIVIECGGKTIMATHGHRLLNGLCETASNMDVVLYGHTHVALIEKKGGTLFCNPGSMSIPKSEHSGYLILSDDAISLRDIDGNIILSADLSSGH